MKTIHIALAALSLVAATASQAVEATRFEAPAMSTVSRTEVQAEANRASAAGELRSPENYPRFVAPTGSDLSRKTVQAEAAQSGTAHSHGDPTIASHQFIGGM